jgi:hypothetical protein
MAPEGPAVKSGEDWSRLINHLYLLANSEKYFNQFARFTCKIVSRHDGFGPEKIGQVA